MFEFYKFNNIQRIEKELEFHKEIEYLLAKDHDKDQYLTSKHYHKMLHSFIFFLIRREEGILIFVLDGRRKIKLKLWEGKYLIFLQLMGYFC